MTKVSIISGFLGAGKTTLIRKLLAEVFAGEQIVLIENEYGEIGIDGSFLKDSGVQITEMNSGCICCTLVGDFTKSLQQVIEQYHPVRIIIEPSGVGKLSDIVTAVEKVRAVEPELVITEKIAVVDAKKAKLYLKNFGEFFKNQVEHASTIVLSRTQDVTEEKLQETVALLRELNAAAPLITTPWSELAAEAIRHALEHSDVESLIAEEEEECCCHHHHDEDEEEHEHHHHHHHGDDDDDDDEECCCHHHHDEDEEEHGHHHHHHHDDDDDDDDDEECCCHLHHDEDEEEHEHHHHHHDDDDDDDDDEECCCHHHHDEDEEEHGHHHHHHHHHADEVFTSWGRETAKKFSPEEFAGILKTLAEDEGYGTILRAKGIIPLTDGSWKQFDLVPEESEVRDCAADYTGRICVIGCQLAEDRLAELFGL